MCYDSSGNPKAVKLTNSFLDSNCVETAQIRDGKVTDAKIKDMDGDKLFPESVTVGKLSKGLETDYNVYL